MPALGFARLEIPPTQSAITMSVLSNKPMRFYATGLLCTAAGAWLTDVTGSLLPLSLGGAVLVMATLPVVRAIRARHTKRRDIP